MATRIVYHFEQGDFIRSFAVATADMKRAATEAMKEAGKRALEGGRAGIARAGFSRRWQVTYRLDVFPKGKNSMNAAAFLHHRIPYSNIFQTGGLISGQPRLWLPLSATPAMMGRNRLTAGNFTALTGKKLISIRRPGKLPLLGAVLNVSPRRKKIRGSDLKSKAQLSTGGGSDRVGFKDFGTRGRLVPLFVGISTVRIRKQFDVERATNDAANAVPDLYFEKLRAIRSST